MGSSKFSQILGSLIVQSERSNGMDGQMKMDGCAKVLLKWGAPSWWSFRPNSAWVSIRMATIGKTHVTHPTLDDLEDRAV